MSKRPSLTAMKDKKTAKDQDNGVSSNNDSVLSLGHDKVEAGVKPLKQQIVRLNADAHKQLKMLGVERGESVNEMMIKLINELFERNGKQPIA